jgi:hypothetical protein
MEPRVLLSTGVLPTWSQDEGEPVTSGGIGASFGQGPGSGAPTLVTAYDAKYGDELVAAQVFNHGPPLGYIVVGAFNPADDGTPDTNFANSGGQGGTVISTEGDDELATPVAGYSIVDASGYGPQGWSENPDAFAGAQPLGIWVDQNGNIDIAVELATVYEGPTVPTYAGIGVLELNSTGTSMNYFEGLESPSWAGTGTDSYQGCCAAYDPATNDILIGGYDASGNAQSNSIWAFHEESGLVDSNFGSGGEFETDSHPSPPYGFFDEFTALTVDSDASDSTYGDIYAGDDYNGAPQVTAITPDGTGLLASFNSGSPFQLTTFAPAGTNSVTIDSVFGLTVYNGNVISANPVSWTDPSDNWFTGVGLTEVNAATGAGTNFGPNNDGQLFVRAPEGISVASGAFSYSATMALNQDNGDVAITYVWGESPAWGTQVAQWVNGATWQYENLDQTYTNVNVPDDTPSAAFVTGGPDSGGLLVADIDQDTFDLALGYYGPALQPNPPQLVSAESIQNNANGNSYAINVNLNVGPGQLPTVEGRQDNSRLYLALDFESAISIPATGLTFSLTDTLGATDGSVGSSSYFIDPSNSDQLDVYLSNVLNRETLVFTVDGVQDQATGVTGDFTLKLGFMLGDTNGDGIVNAQDLAAVDSNFNQATNSDNYLCDFNGGGVINSPDFADLIINYNQGLTY